MNEKTSKAPRNYYLDFIKLIFAGFVFISHSLNNFANQNTWIPFDVSVTSMGYVSVHCFFIISGLLMINSYEKYIGGNDAAAFLPGKSALNFVLRKYKSIALPYLTALGINLAIYTFVNGFSKVAPRMPFLFSEAFLLMQGGAKLGVINFHNWYISAMLVAMLPLAYILFRNKDFYIHVFAPSGALILLGYFFSSEFSSSSHYLDQYAYCGFITGGVIRAAAGICAGAVAYLISEKLREHIVTKKQRLILTISEALLYLIFFAVWFNTKKNEAYSTIAMMLLPLIIAVVFSCKSYTVELFKNKIFSKCGNLALAVYLTHWGAEIIIMNLMPGLSYKVSLALMVGITAVSIILYFLIIKLFRYIGKKDKNNF